MEENAPLRPPRFPLPAPCCRSRCVGAAAPSYLPSPSPPINLPLRRLLSRRSRPRHLRTGSRLYPADRGGMPRRVRRRAMRCMYTCTLSCLLTRRVRVVLQVQLMRAVSLPSRHRYSLCSLSKLSHLGIPPPGVARWASPSPGCRTVAGTASAAPRTASTARCPLHVAQGKCGRTTCTIFAEGTTRGRASLQVHVGRRRTATVTMGTTALTAAMTAATARRRCWEAGCCGSSSCRTAHSLLLHVVLGITINTTNTMLHKITRTITRTTNTCTTTNRPRQQSS